MRLVQLGIFTVTLGGFTYKILADVIQRDSKRWTQFRKSMFQN